MKHSIAWLQERVTGTELEIIELIRSKFDPKSDHDETKSEAFQLLADRDRLTREIELLHNCAHNDIRKIDDLNHQLSVWRKAFKHTHVAGKGEDLDACDQCGLNFRDSIHLRVGEE